MVSGEHTRSDVTVDSADWYSSDVEHRMVLVHESALVVFENVNPGEHSVHVRSDE